MISVIIPTFKRSDDIIENAIKSVVNQTYNDIEIILVDDNNENHYSNNIVDNDFIMSHVKYIKHAANLGACAARNTGAKNSKGEWLAFLDDDDLWMDNKLEKQLSKCNEEVGLVYCGIRINNLGSSIITDRLAYKINNPVKELLIHNVIGSTSVGLVNRKAFIDVGMFDTQLGTGQDVDLWIRIAKKYKIDFIYNPLIIYNMNNVDSIHTNVYKRLQSNKYLRIKYSNIINWDKKLKTIYALKITKGYLLNKMFIKAFFIFFKMVFIKEISIKELINYSQTMSNCNNY